MQIIELVTAIIVICLALFYNITNMSSAAQICAHERIYT